MDTLIEMREALQSDFSVGENSSFFPPEVIDSALNRAYRKVGALFDWPQLEDAKKTVTEANENYLDAPKTWKANSMWRLEINGVPYGDDPDHAPMSYHDFLDWKSDSNNANSTDKKWAIQWLRYFFTPTPTEAGLVVCIWGQKNVAKMTDDDDITIFSYNSPHCNEAIVLEADAILNRKSNTIDEGRFLSAEAKQILVLENSKLRKLQARSKKTQVQYNTPDFYATNGNGIKSSSDLIGRF